MGLDKEGVEAWRMCEFGENKIKSRYKEVADDMIGKR
jgi:hypothetical protein